MENRSVMASWALAGRPKPRDSTILRRPASVTINPLLYSPPFPLLAVLLHSHLAIRLGRKSDICGKIISMIMPMMAITINGNIPL